MKVPILVISLAMYCGTCVFCNATSTSTQMLPSYRSSIQLSVSNPLLTTSYTLSETTLHVLTVNVSQVKHLNSSEPVLNTITTDITLSSNTLTSNVMVNSLNSSLMSTSVSLHPISPTQVSVGETSITPSQAETLFEEMFQSASLTSQSLDADNSRNVSKLVSESSYTQSILTAYTSSLDASIVSSSSHIAPTSVNVLSITSTTPSSSGQFSDALVSSDVVRSEMSKSFDIQPTSSFPMSPESSYQHSTLVEDIFPAGSGGAHASTSAILSDTHSYISITSSLDTYQSDTYHSSFPSTKYSDILSTAVVDIFPSTNRSFSAMMSVYSTTANTFSPSTAELFSSTKTTQPDVRLLSVETQHSSLSAFISLSSSYHTISSAITPTTTLISVPSSTDVIVSVSSTLDFETTSAAGVSSLFHSSTVINVSETTAENTSTDTVKTTLHQTSTSNVADSTSHVIQTTHAPTISRDYLESFSILITFKDKCNNLKSVAQLQMEFFKALVDVVIATVGAGIVKENIHLNDFSCDPLSVGIALRNLSSEKTLQSITESINNSTFVVQIIDENRIVQFRGNKAKLTEVETEKAPKLSDTSIEQRDIIIISTASFLFMVLLFFGSVIICRECYLRKRAASFNLLDVPHVDLKLTDFTLTKIPRPHISYCEPPSSRLCQHVYNGQHYDSCLPGSAIHGGKKIAINAEDVRVRIHDHDGGLLVGVTCTPPPSPTEDSMSSSSSPCSDSTDKAKQNLLKGDNSKCYGKGTLNPIYADEEDKVEPNKGLKEHGENMEHMV